MRVLSKAELQHSVLLQDLETVMENFGVMQDAPDEKPTQEDLDQSKKKKNKQEQMVKFFKKEDGTVYLKLIEVLMGYDFDLDRFHESIK